MSARIRRKARSGVYSSTCLMPSTTHCYCCSATRRARTRAHPSNVTRYHRVIKGLFLGADCSPPLHPASLSSFDSMAFCVFQSLPCVEHVLRWTTVLPSSPNIRRPQVCAPLFALRASFRVFLRLVLHLHRPHSPTLHQRRDLLLFLLSETTTTRPVEWGSREKRQHSFQIPVTQNAQTIPARTPRGSTSPATNNGLSTQFFLSKVFYSFSVRRTGSGCCPTFAKSQPAGRSHSNSFRGGEGWLRAKGGEFY